MDNNYPTAADYARNAADSAQRTGRQTERRLNALIDIVTVLAIDISYDHRRKLVQQLTMLREG